MISWGWGRSSPLCSPNRVEEAGSSREFRHSPGRTPTARIKNIDPGVIIELDTLRISSSTAFTTYRFNRYEYRCMSVLDSEGFRGMFSTLPHNPPRNALAHTSSWAERTGAMGCVRELLLYGVLGSSRAGA